VSGPLASRAPAPPPPRPPSFPRHHAGGAKAKPTTLAYKRMPFDTCSLSLTQWRDPVMTPDGTLFDLTHM
jgi:hypothetical protein